MRRRPFLALAVALPAHPGWCATAGRFDPARDAETDVREAVSAAKAKGKLVLVDLGGEWCVWCKILDRFIASRPQVMRELEDGYIMVKVNFSPQNKNEKLLSQWPKPAGYPHFYVLNGEGRLLASQNTGELEAGQDYDERKMLAFLRAHRPAR